MITGLKDIRIAPSSSDLREVRAKLSPQQVRQALYQATLRTTRTMTTNLRKRSKDKLAINQKYISRAINFTIDRGDVPVGTIIVQRQGVPLIGYKTSATRAGIFAMMDRDRGGLQLRHAFKAVAKGPLPDGTESGGHLAIWLREKGVSNTGHLTAGGYAPRLPIREVYGAPVISVVEEAAERESFVRDVRILYRKNILSQVSRFTQNTAADAGE